MTIRLSRCHALWISMPRFLLLLPLASLAAAGAAEPDFTSMSLDELSTIEVGKVYAASKHEQKLTDAPSAVSIVTADDIKKQGYRTLTDLLRSVRGFYVTSDRGYNVIGTRGINIPGDFGGRLLIAVDGHRMNDPVYDSAASGTDFILDVDLIERVEVIRGPGSSLYGNNAFLGVINVVTRKGHDASGAELSGSAATFDTYTGRLTYGNEFRNGLELMISGTFYDSAGDRSLYYPEFSAVNNGFAQNMDGGRAGSGFASLSWKGFLLELGYVNREKTWPTAPYSAPDAIVIFNDPHFVTTDRRGYANLQFTHAFEDEWELLASASYDYYGFDAVYPFDYLDPLQPLTLNQDRAQAQSAGGLVQVTKTFAKKHRVTFGTELRYDFQLDQHNADLDPPASYLDSQESARFYSFYVQDEFQIVKNLILNAGLRYDEFSTFGDTLNPRVAIIYHPWEPTTFKFIYGSAFRAPNAYENYYETFNYKRNPALAPETIRSYELVYEQRVGRNWSGSASLFVNDIQGLIAIQQDPADDYFFFDNVNSVQARGAELEVAAHWTGGLRGRASYTYTHTEDTTGQRLINSPEHLGQLELSGPLWRNKLFASVELQAMSERLTVGGNTVRPVWLANATLFSRELAKGLEVSGGVYNLFDQHYRDPVSEDFTQDSIEQDGRVLRLKLTYRF